MATREQAKPSVEPDSVGHETTELRVRWFWWFVGGLVVTAAVIHVGLWLLLRDYTEGPAGPPARSIVSPSPLPERGPPLQPVPRRDLSPAQDLQAMYRMEDRTFEQLGWHADPLTHQVRIPEAVVQHVIRQTATTQPGGQP